MASRRLVACPHLEKETLKRDVEAGTCRPNPNPKPPGLGDPANPKPPTLAEKTGVWTTGSVSSSCFALSALRHRGLSSDPLSLINTHPHRSACLSLCLSCFSRSKTRSWLLLPFPVAPSSLQRSLRGLGLGRGGSCNRPEAK